MRTRNRFPHFAGLHSTGGVAGLAHVRLCFWWDSPAGLINSALFAALSSAYTRDVARAVSIGGILFGAGCLASALLVALTFYSLSVTGALLLLAVVPGVFAFVYYRMNIPAIVTEGQPSLLDAVRDFRSFGTVAFALLLFFQFGNEWAIAGWLPMFLIEQLGISPKTSILLLALYWTALLVGRVVLFAILRRVGHGRLLFISASAAAFGCILLFFTNNLFGATMSVLLIGFGFAAIYPLVAEGIGRRFTYYHPGLFNGVFSLALAGGMLAPATLGLFADDYGIRVVVALPLIGTLMVVGTGPDDLAGKQGNRTLMRNMYSKLALAALLASLMLAAPPKTKKKPVPRPPVNAAPLEAQIAEILSAPVAKEAFWGIEVRDLKTDKIVYSQNADHLFVPASNTKLFTTAMALTRLGPGYRFHTRVLFSGSDLILVGAGDPNLSGRTLPVSTQPTRTRGHSPPSISLPTRSWRRASGVSRATSWATTPLSSTNRIRRAGVSATCMRTTARPSARSALTTIRPGCRSSPHWRTARLPKWSGSFHSNCSTSITPCLTDGEARRTIPLSAAAGKPGTPCLGQRAARQRS